MKKILSELKRSLLTSKDVIVEYQQPEDSNVHLYDYEIYDYWVPQENRSFDLVVNYDSEDGVDGITIVSAKESFDVNLYPDGGGPPKEIADLFTVKFDTSTGKDRFVLNKELPSDWTYDDNKELVYHKVGNFKNILIKNKLLKTFEKELFEIATSKNAEASGNFD